MGLTISAFIAALQKANSIVGDVPVVLHDVEAGVETELKKFGLDFDLTGSSQAGVLKLQHGRAAPEASAATGETQAAQAA